MVAGSPAGWKAKANPDTTSPETIGAGYAHWSFIADAQGYNYFTDRDKIHNVQLEAVKLPFNSMWESGGFGTINEYLGVELKYKDTQDNYQSVSKVFTAYPPITGAGGIVDLNAGIGKLRGTLDRFATEPTSPYYAQRVWKGDLPSYFTDRKYGWTDKWIWYNWSNWKDFWDVSSKRMFPAIEFNVDNPPHVGFINYKADGKTPYDQAFVNQESQFILRTPNGVNQGNTLQPWQMKLRPVNNATSTGSEMTPREYTTTLSIPQGDYTYDELAQLLTDKLNKLPSPVVGLSNNPTDPTQPINVSGYSSSYLLQSSYELMTQYDGYNVTNSGGASIGTDGYPTYPNSWVYSSIITPVRTDPPLAEIPARLDSDAGVQPYWVSEDTSRLFAFNKDYVKGVPRLVGAENFSIIFDDSSQSFQILEAHTPLYIDGPILSASGVTPVVRGPGSTVLKQLRGSTDPSITFIGSLKTADTSSGCFITDLQPRSLWFNKMGFNADILSHAGAQNFVVQDFTVNPTSGVPSQFTGDDSVAACKCHPLSLETGFFSGVDALITKNSEFAVINAWTENVEVNTPMGLKGTTIIQSSDDQPFYNIEISGINNQNISGQVFENNLIQGIVGKYFSSGNFTQSTGDGFLYTHKGTPLTISSLRIRVLDTQMTPEDGLGPNSAFVLQIDTSK